MRITLKGQNHLVFFDKDMEIFNALSYLSIAGKIKSMSKAVVYYKEKEGRGAMSEAVRKYAMEYAKEYGEEQKQEGIQTGRRTEIYLSVQDRDYSVQRGAEKAGLSLEEFKKSMSEAGYKLPEPV